MKIDGWESELLNVFIISTGKYVENLNNMPMDLNIFSNYHVYMSFECEMFIKNYSQNFILLVSSIVADPILILVK